MQIAVVAAGFTGGEADQLRRAMAAWKRKGGLEPFKEKLLAGMLARGYDECFALRIYNQIKGFSDYGFPESHSASFALLAYVSSWLKCHYPAAFTCALLNSQPMGFYAPAQLIQDLQRHGVAVLPVDVNRSDVDCSLEFTGNEPALRLGLRLVKGLSRSAAESISAARNTGLFSSIDNLLSRTRINRKDSESLAAADALQQLGGDRYRAFWQVGAWEPPLPVISSSGVPATVDIGTTLDLLLPKPDEAQNIIADYLSTGLTLRRHPLALLRQHLSRYHVASAQTLPAIRRSKRVKVAGIVTCRQRPQTAKGVTFLTLEDESGFINVVVWPSLAEKYRLAVNHGSLLGVAGTLQHSEEGVIHVIARDLVDLSEWLQAMELKSRDFC
jgi:error-prone DNA polymerase